MRPRLIAMLVAGALLLPATAAADFQTFYDDYRADGTIDVCAQSQAELSAALGDIPADIREYDPGFADAINVALEQAAICGSAPQKAAVIKDEVISADGSPGPAAPKSAGVTIADSGRDMPPVLIALSLLLAATLLFATIIGLRSLRNKSGG